MGRLATYVCLLLGIFAGCTSPIYNVIDSPITTASGKELSMEQVRKAIVEAGAPKWAIVDIQPGHLVGTLHLRDHVASVDIKYNTKKYSITYKDSTNLDYREGKQGIHEAYIDWVQDLDNAIRAKLSTAGSEKGA